MIENYIQNSTIKQKTYPAKQAGNYRIFPQLTTKHFVEQGEKSFPALVKNLDNNKQVVETLYILDRIQENKTGDCAKIYPALSKHNKTKNPEIQTFLAGIYRKTQVPDSCFYAYSKLTKPSKIILRSKRRNWWRNNILPSLITYIF